MEKEHSTRWQQHYPTYTYAERDIVLSEYESASRSVETEERIFLNSTNLILVLLTAVGTIGIGSIDKISKLDQLPVSNYVILMAAIIIFLISPFLALKYFAERQKSILFSKRKIVILRSMLGLNYGNLQLILPSWRYEGATQPFAIKLFPGWSSVVAYPFWILSLTFSLFIFLASSIAWQKFSPQNITPESFGIFASTSCFLLFALAYRSSLFDTHESPGLCAIKLLAKLLNLRLTIDFEYIIYRSKLSFMEQERLKINTNSAIPILIFIEDRGFFYHHGISARGMIRAARNYIVRRRKTGGSTITQQLVRSLFIEDLSKKLRRKIIEIFLALWIEKIISKEEILNMYLGSVRFDYKVFGFASASKHFFGELIQNPSKAQIFFLIERISNIRGRILFSRIDDLIRQAIENSIISEYDAKEIVNIYKDQAFKGNLIPASNEKLDSLIKKWSEE